MNVVGLITEYNPFHNGHLYHIQEAKRLTGADTVVVVMSGNFVQRGTVSLLDKYARTKMALEAGADVVIELPVCYATASAEYFAMGGVSLLHGLQCVDSIVFGSECGNLPLLQTIASIYEDEPSELTSTIQSLLKKGYNYPAARASALISYMSNKGYAKDYKGIDLEEVIQSPNNILGIEYLRALLRLKSSIKPYTIKRIQSNFHDENLTGTISSATSIRHNIESEKHDSIRQIKHAVPESTYKILKQNYEKTFPIVVDDISFLLNYKLLTETVESLQQYLDISEDLAYRIINQKNLTSTFSQYVDSIRTKQYTQTRIQRSLLHILLNITNESMHRYAKIGYTPYARILGFRTLASAFIKQCSQSDSLTVLTKLAKVNLESVASEMLNQDIYATNLYNLLVAQRFGIEPKNEYTHGLVLIKE